MRRDVPSVVPVPSWDQHGDIVLFVGIWKQKKKGVQQNKISISLRVNVIL